MTNDEEIFSGTLKDLLDMQESATVVKTPKIIPVTVKRTVTQHGFTINNARNGDTVYIHLDSIVKGDVVTKDGRTFKDVITVNRIDAFGNDLGWVSAEHFFL